MNRNPLINLLVKNNGRGFFRAQASEDSATVWLYDTIVSDDYWGGVSALAFAKELAGIKADTIHLRINSPGGDVFAGRAMEQAIREHSASVIVHVDGYAASAASYVALAGDEVFIAPGGMFMIHKAMTIGWGNSEDFLSVAALLDQIDGTIADSYVARTGQSREQLIQWMAEETWFTAQRSVELGFADAIASGEQKEAAANAADWDFSAYKHAPAPVKAAEPADAPAPVDRDALIRRLSAAALTA